MINGKEFYQVISAVVPLYVTMLLAYGSVRWWKIFTPDQCSGINRFVAVFAVPFLVFKFVAMNNPYSMNFLFIGADAVQKIVTLVALFVSYAIVKWPSLDWVIVLYSVSCLPNTLIMGVPLLSAMYGDSTLSLMTQIMFVQSVLWNTVMLVLFEYRAAMILITEQFPGTAAAAISTFQVDSDVVSLCGREPLDVSSQRDEDGKVKVVVRRSLSSASSVRSSFDCRSRLRVSDLSGVDIFSVQSPLELDRNPTTNSVKSMDSNLVLPKTSNQSRNSSQGIVFGDAYPIEAPTSGIAYEIYEDNMLHMRRQSSDVSPYRILNPPPPSVNTSGSLENKGLYGRPNNNLHMFVWSSSQNSVADRSNLKPADLMPTTSINVAECGEGPLQLDLNQNESNIKETGLEKQQMPSAAVLTRLIIIMSGRKLTRNPNTYAMLLGLIWSLIAFRFSIELPVIVKGCLDIIADTGIGLAMFSLGLFISLQPRLIACGMKLLSISMAVKFLVGPAVMAATSAALGLRGHLLKVAIVQAALPLAILPFVFAKEYNVKPELLSTSVIFGMVVALPVTIIYYVLLGL